MVAGAGLEPHDLQVMSLTSYRTALPRDSYIIITIDFVFVKRFKVLFILCSLHINIYLLSAFCLY